MAIAFTHADLANMVTRLENSIANAMSEEKIANALGKSYIVEESPGRCVDFVGLFLLWFPFDSFLFTEIEESFLSYLVEIVISRCIYAQSDSRID
jgi:hypothetical protein